ncbi:DUF6596 domain-containing protein [Cellulomonas bogoriensis]|uniref:DUF6596 domain-containing protein n=1 Tax=Cellulomonas bogoriensis TaxID=301388 RepID=UPI00068C45B6|nr:DUF6596 domain-containing protein [Cellulomonas bogoriensis]
MAVDAAPPPAPAADTDDTLWLYFLCAHPSLSPGTAVALTLRAVGGLTTAQIARAYLVPEAIRLTRGLARLLDHPEVCGLLALMLLHQARRDARTTADGALVPLADQDRTRWDTALIAEGVTILQAALARDRLGEYQAQAAIAALHADAPTVEQTDWVQVLEWYDELVRLTDSPVARLNRAVAVGHAARRAAPSGTTSPGRRHASTPEPGRGSDSADRTPVHSSP